jgi:hypothetical protein
MYENVFTLVRSPFTARRLAARSPQLKSWLGSLSRGTWRRNAARCLTEPLLEDRPYFPVRRVAADLAIGPALEQIFRRDHIDIVDRLAHGAMKLSAVTPSEDG